MKPRRITVRGVIVKDGKLLAQELKPASDGKKRDYWCTPGGGLDPGEPLYDGLVREMIEETGITPTVGKLLFIQQYEDDEKEFIEFFYHVTNADDYISIDLSSTTHGEAEVEIVDFIDPAKHNILPAFLQTIDIQSHIDEDKPVLITNELGGK